MVLNQVKEGAAILLGAALAFGATAVLSEAQVVAEIGVRSSDESTCAPVNRRASAWIGVSLNERISVDERGRRSSDLTVRCVMRGSPASEWLLPGDHIVRVNQRTASLEIFGRFATALRPGDPVTLTVARPGGSTQELTIRAAEPPDDPLSFLPTEVVGRIHEIMEELDRRDTFSVRVEEMGTIRLADGETRIDVSTAPRDGGRFLLYRRNGVQDDSTVELRPFSTFNLLGDMRVASQAAQGNPGEAPPLRHLATSEPVNVLVGSEVDALTLWKRNDLLAGAQFAVLVPGLAEYFAVDRGLLVTEVLQATPAHEVGLRPGDVVLSVDGRATRTVEALRAEWARQNPEEGERSLLIVRSGSQLEIPLRRR